MKMVDIERKERFLSMGKPDFSVLEKGMQYALGVIDKNMAAFAGAFPSGNSENHMYSRVENDGWTTGFWPGLIWLAYSYTGDDKYRRIGDEYIESFRRRFEAAVGIDNHDLGFMYTLSAIAPYKLTGNKAAAELALKAAYHLIGRYRSKGEFILAWGDINQPQNPRGNRMIIDCMMNLPLLYWAAAYSGNTRFADIALAHADTSLNYLLREDFSTHHTFYFDYDSGAPIGGVQHQGYSDSSCWARGQAWAAYGFALSYSHSYKEEYLNASINTINYFLNHIPEDTLCYYDLYFESGNEPRDSSANAIVCCAVFEVLKHLPLGNALRETYEKAVYRLLSALAENFTVKDIAGSNGILNFGTVAKPPAPANECTLYGDYFYTEALVRALKAWRPFW